MKKEEYSAIRELAWDILLKSNTSCLPVKITPIAKIYGYKNIIDYNMSRIDNTYMLSRLILTNHKITANALTIKTLAIRILCPMCILYECNITNSKKISEICDIPENIALERANRLQILIKRNKFYSSDIEYLVYMKFEKFIEEYKKINGTGKFVL